MGLPVAEERIVETETQLGRRLPDGFRERTKQSNGGTDIKVGRTRFTLYAVWDPTDRKTMTRSASHVIRETESLYRYLGDLLPPGGVVLGSDNGGNALLVLPDDSIVVWTHGDPTKPRPADGCSWVRR